MSRKMLGLLIGAVVALAGCSSSPSTSSTPPATGAPQVAATSPAAPSTPASTPTAALSGKWNGQYGGAYQGTFVLNWTQGGSKLTGTINLSSPATTLTIHGNVTGNTITFGTVGAYGITYSGTVNGGSMSGTYQVKGSGGGQWSATKS